MHIIPKRTRVRMEFFKDITLPDIIFLTIGVGGAIGLFMSNLPLNTIWALIWAALIFALFVKIEDGVRTYTFLGMSIRFIAFKKKYTKNGKKGAPISSIIPFVGIKKDKYIDYKTYKARVIEVIPILFGLLDEHKQSMIIRTFANALRRLSNDQTASIVKVNMAMVLDSYIKNEEDKYDQLLYMEDKGQISEIEVEARTGVFENRASALQNINKNDKQFKDRFFIVVYDNDEQTLDATIEGMQQSMNSSAVPVQTNILYGKELAVFLKATYGKEFDEREIDLVPTSEYAEWAMPNDIKFRMGGMDIDGVPYKKFAITDYPIEVGNAWGASFFLLDKTNVTVNFKPIQKIDAEKAIDKALLEMEAKYYKSGKTSAKIETETHISTLRTLLESLKNNNEQLFDTNIHITCEEPAKKEVRAILKQSGFKFSEMFGRQVDSLISSSISRLDTIKQYWRGIPTTSLAAIYPFISSALQDPKGIYIGYNEYPVFVNFFGLRDLGRQNSNMVIIGKSGSGKSYATKNILANLAADNSKVLILDPEDEYRTLAESLHGKILDVGSSRDGILNPFHIMTSLEVDEEYQDKLLELEKSKKKDLTDEELDALKENSNKISDALALHLQFLEQFFQTVLPGLGSDAGELLNLMVSEMYSKKGITNKTNIANLNPEDFPTFDDLDKVIKKHIKDEKDEYRRQNYKVIETYIEKFTTGGRNSNLWNGPTSIETQENFITFSFRSLLANRNQTIANAQMLLIFKYIDNEIIKNREFNNKHGTKRKIIVAVDEAHVFINPKFPIALDFMAQMAKRIRKYSGMQIIITQNVKDFVGSPEIQRQSTAVINASQYSFIFSLAPNDMTDLVELYRHSGEINEDEQDAIVTANTGKCFLITGPLNRTVCHIEALPYVAQLFGEHSGG